MAKENDPKNESQGILIRLRRNQWWRWLTRAVLILVVVAGLLMVFASNQFLYLSHQRFSGWSHLQLKYQLDSDVERSRPQIIGHRGSGIDSTDSGAKDDNKLIGNTARAIQAAINAKVDWIEIDIRMSKEGELIVFHDSNVAAKTNFDDCRASLNGSTGEVSGLNLAQLGMLTLNVKPKEKILTLDKLFDSFHSNKTKWIFDIKADGIHQAVTHWLDSKNIPPNQLMLFGDYEVLNEKEYRDSGYRLGYTTLFSKSLKTMLLDQSEMFNRCDTIKCNLVVVPIFFVTSSFVNSAAARDIDVWCYDSNDERDLKYATGCGVKGVIVDHPMRTMAMFDLDNRDK